MKKKLNRDKYFNLKQLKLRNWTQTKIDKWLKEPDELATNPIYKTAAPQKLYLIKRVKAQEKNKRFKDWVEKYISKRKNLSIASTKANESKRVKLLEYVKNLKIEIPFFTKKELFIRAIDCYNTLWCNRGEFDKYASLESDEDFLKRISINMLRHDQKFYESELDNMFGKVGKDEGYINLKNRINQEIFKIYPYLKN